MAKTNNSDSDNKVKYKSKKAFRKALAQSVEDMDKDKEFSKTIQNLVPLMYTLAIHGVVMQKMSESLKETFKEEKELKKQ